MNDSVIQETLPAPRRPPAPHTPTTSFITILAMPLMHGAMSTPRQITEQLLTKIVKPYATLWWRVQQAFLVSSSASRLMLGLLGSPTPRTNSKNSTLIPKVGSVNVKENEVKVSDLKEQKTKTTITY